MPSYFFLIIIFQVCLAQYSIDLSYPYLLTPESNNIVDVSIDQQNSYLVSFKDSQARRYAPDFSTYTQLYVTQVVQRFHSKTLQLSISMSDSKIFSMICDMTITLSKNATVLRAYTYPQFFDIHFFSFTEPIIDYQGLPIQFSTINPLHLLVFNSTTKIIYDDVITTVFDVAQTFGISFYNTAVGFKEYTISEGTDEVSFTFAYYHTIATLGLVQVNIIVKFNYDVVLSKFSMTYSSNYTIVKALSEDIQKITIANNVVMMQYYSYKLLLYVENVNFEERQDLWIQKYQILDFFYAFDTYYILFTNGLIKVSINEAFGIFLDTALVNSLPNNLYQLAFGINDDILFIPGTPNIYKAKCINQSFYSTGTCTKYSCEVANCKSCPFIAKICQTCADGFKKVDQYNCAQQATKGSMMGNTLYNTNDTLSNMSNTDNTTSSTNTSSPATTNTSSPATTNTSSPATTNTSSPATTNTSSPATTNTSSPATTNTSSTPILTNSTNISNTSTLPIFTNTSTFSQTNVSNFSTYVENSAYSTLFPFLASFSQLFSGMLNGTKDMMSVPSLRSVSPTFYFFANFDDLYLYVFHDRLYGDVMTGLFNQLTDIQNKKWSLFGYGTLLQLFGLSSSSFYQRINYQSSYISYNFITPDHPDLGSQAILVNCTNFFLVAAPLIILIFIVFRIVFRLLFQYPISQLLRKFDIWGCLFVTLFDGNIQQFAFYTTSEWKNIFFFLMGDKFVKIFAIYFGFILVMVSVGAFLMAFAYYGKLNKYLVDNNKNSLAGVFFLLLQYGLRNFVLGVLHSILRPLPYLTMLKLLLIVELFFTLAFILSFSLNIYKFAKIIWFYLLISFVRILLISTLAVDYECTNYEIIENTQCTLLVIMLLIYLLATLTVIVLISIQLFSNIAKVFKTQTIKKAAFGNPNGMDYNIDTECIHEENNRRQSKKTRIRKLQLVAKSKSDTVFIIKHAILKIIEVEKGGRQS